MKNDKFINISELVRDSENELSERAQNNLSESEMNIINLENMRNDDIFRIIMQNQTYKDLLDELKSS